MNEANQNCMYDEVKEVKNLNGVEGFDPRKYMRIIQEEGGRVTFYLDVAFRKLWFRLKYPEGKIVKKILKLTEQVAIVEAKVYLNRSDGEENFIANAFAQKYFSSEDMFGSKYVELAETAAVGRALTDAGFGLQFSDRDGEIDPQVTEAPFEAGMLFPEEGLPEGTYMDMESVEDGFGDSESMAVSEGSELTENREQIQRMDGDNQKVCNIEGQMEEGKGVEGQTIAGQTIAGQTAEVHKSNSETQKRESETAGEEVMGKNAVMGKKAVAEKTNVAEKAIQGASASADTQTESKRKQNVTEIRKDMPVEQIYDLLTRESAAAVVIPTKYYHGMTLGQLAMEKPQALEWYVTSYGGPDNLLRAAARFLMDSALKQAG